MTIRASLPNDEQSRVILGDTDEAKTKVFWESDDVITVTTTTKTYTFTISKFDSNSTTADFHCDEIPDFVIGQEYTFTYSSAPVMGGAQTGTKEGLSAYHQMQATYTAQQGGSLDNVDLNFRTQVSIVELSLNNGAISVSNPATKVTMYDVKTGTCLSTATGTFTDKVYFSVLPGTYQAFFLIETTNGKYVKKVSESTMAPNKLYRIKHTDTNPMAAIQTFDKSNVKYFTLGGIAYICGYGNDESVVQSDAFKGNDNLQSVTMLGVTGIGSDAFRACKNLIDVYISNGVKTIQYNAFYQCKNLNRVTIPATVTKIESSAFYQCQLECNITLLPVSPPVLSSDVFGPYPSNYNYFVPADKVGTYKAASDWSSFKDEIQAIP